MILSSVRIAQVCFSPADIVSMRITSKSSSAIPGLGSLGFGVLLPLVLVVVATLLVGELGGGFVSSPLQLVATMVQTTATSMLPMESVMIRGDSDSTRDFIILGFSRGL